MQLARNCKGIARLAMLLLLVIFFLLGAVLSYVWTMGFYAPSEFNLPSRTTLAIENVIFPQENATFFNVTILNPSYSRSDAVIDQIKVVTNDGKVYSVLTSPTLPLKLASGRSQIIQSFWNWSNYTGQTVDVYVLIVDGSGAVFQAKTAFMNLTVTDVIFEPSMTSTRFNLTVQSQGSPISVDINSITVNGIAVTDVTPALPYQLNPNVSANFILHRDWTDLQNKTVSVTVKTKQGYEAFKTVTAPLAKLNITSVQFFNTTATAFYFNVTIQNSAVPSAQFDINLITVTVDGQNITIEKTDVVNADLPKTLPPDSSVLLMCRWDWSPFQTKNVTVTVYTVQGFKASAEATIPNI